MTDVSKSLTIIAYYLSEYDTLALKALGYDTQKSAIKSISVIFNRDNNYLKLRRDEFDALPDSSSSRNGWRNRPPAKEVINVAAHLKTFSFDELTDLVRTIIDAQSGSLSTNPATVVSDPNERTYSETELENLKLKLL